MPSIFFSRILRSDALVSKSYFFQNSRPEVTHATSPIIRQFLRSPGDEIGKIIPTQSSQRKEYPVARVHLPVINEGMEEIRAPLKKPGRESPARGSTTH